jgi:hypothetical protein
MKKQTAKLSIGVVMNRTWKILLIVGSFGLITELIFMIAKLAIVGNQVEGKYAIIWFASSIMCLITSALIAALIYGKPYIHKLRDWVYRA